MIFEKRKLIGIFPHEEFIFIFENVAHDSWLEEEREDFEEIAMVGG